MTCKDNGRKVEKILLYNDMRVINICFKYKYTLSATGSYPITDYIIFSEKTVVTIILQCTAQPSNVSMTWQIRLALLAGEGSGADCQAAKTNAMLSSLQ
jgi:hypothetical protein